MAICDVYSTIETTLTKTLPFTLILRPYPKRFSFPQGCRVGPTKMYSPGSPLEGLQ